MKRRLSTLLSAVSLVLLIGLLGLWVGAINSCVGIERSGWTAEGNIGHYRSRSIRLAGGRVIITEVKMTTLTPDAQNTYRNATETGFRTFSSPLIVYPMVSMGYDERLRDGNGFVVSQESFALPVWLFVTALAVPPFRWAILKKRRTVEERRGAMLCEVCGYDLRETPERCPECGTETRRVEEEGEVDDR